MSPITAQKYFENAEQGTAVPVVTARLVQPGDSVALAVDLGTGPFAVANTVDETSWFVPADKGGYLVAISDKTTLDEKAVLPLNILRHSVEGIEVRKVREGESYVLGCFQVSAPWDGYLLRVEGEWVFFTTAYYQATFGDQQPVEGSMIVTNGEPVKYVILPEAVTFDFAEGEYTAETGMVLYENPEDVDGYTVVSLLAFLSERAMLKA